MTKIVLLHPEQNPEGRTLVQEGTTMYVLTGCCNAKFTHTTDPDGVIWIECTDCGATLDRNDGGWSSDVERLDDWVSYVPSQISEWLEFWFGLRDAGVKVTNS